MIKKHWTMIVPGAVLLCATPAMGVELRDAIQSVANRVATQEELNQGRGLWYPRISVEGSAGVRDLRNPTRRNLGIAGHTLWPIEGDLIFDQNIFDSGAREAEIRRQASRTDAAAARVAERSEFVALNVSRTYIDYLLQQRLVAIAQDNVTFHEKLAADLREQFFGKAVLQRPVGGRFLVGVPKREFQFRGFILEALHAAAERKPFTIRRPYTMRLIAGIRC